MHVKKRRLELGLTQKAVARSLNVSQYSVINWEGGKSKPSDVFTLHRVIEFLGYDPLPAGESIAERLRTKRRQMGWGQRELADHLGVDRCSVSNWELGGTILNRHHRALVAQLLDLPEAEVMEDMANRWNSSHDRGLYRAA